MATRGTMYVNTHTTPLLYLPTWADPVLDRGRELGGSDPGQHGEIGDRGEPCDDVQVRRSVGRIQGRRGGVDEICPRGTGCHPAEVVPGPGEIAGAEIQRSVGVDQGVKGSIWSLLYLPIPDTQKCFDSSLRPTRGFLPSFLVYRCSFPSHNMRAYNHRSSTRTAAPSAPPTTLATPTVHRYPPHYPTSELPLSPTAPFLSLGL